jgi:hypothetical protein
MKEKVLMFQSSIIISGSEGLPVCTHVHTHTHTHTHTHPFFVVRYLKQSTYSQNYKKSKTKKETLFNTKEWM